MEVTARVDVLLNELDGDTVGVLVVCVELETGVTVELAVVVATVLVADAVVGVLVV